jgi:hypothetical protein
LRLLRLAADRDVDRLSEEISLLCTRPRQPGFDKSPSYANVLEWVVQSIVEVVLARLGAVGPGEMFILEVRGQDGSTVDLDALPASGRWVLSIVAAFLAEYTTEGRRQLAAATAHPDPYWRAELLTDTLIWLDYVLGLDLPDPPDVPTR